MGKRRFAGTLSAADHRTTADKYSSQNLTAWIRGWDHGVEVVCTDHNGDDAFEIWTCGGSNARSNGRKMIGKVVNGEFVRSN